jgi:hypothetical protein
MIISSVTGDSEIVMIMIEIDAPLATILAGHHRTEERRTSSLVGRGWFAITVTVHGGDGTIGKRRVIEPTALQTRKEY